ncbi:Cholesterol 7-alpha-monooxygenase [Triplophysa tibetana]|uniref:Cholesterol 7-alpha-monooxygenase n=1 Tax=Triplophysa tibetana TaxID=1572043 RepID=A0A5A9PNI4_9TELE|nr:Cholesterol 7-alpha-monooxygenase [Triplophysa tibetana]
MASFLIVIISVVVLALFIVWICGDWRKRRIGEPPLVSGLPFIGVTLDYARDPLGFIRDTRKKYGDVFTCKIARKYFTFITDPFSLSLVVRQSKNLDFQKFAMGFSQRVFGHSDFTSPVFSGSYREVHSIFRQTLQGPPLQDLAQSMLGNLQVVLGQGLSHEHSWAEEGLQNFTNRIMFEAGFLTLFGREAELLRSDGVECGKTCMQKAAQDFLVFDRAFPALAAGVPIGLCMPAWRAREALAKELLHDELHRRDCISDLIQRRMDVFDRMHLDETDKARTHVCMLSAEALAAARSEVNRVMSGQALNDPDRPICLSREQLDSMSVLESIIEEALRLSSASMMIRVAKDNFTLTLDSGETVAIRKGDFIALYPQLIHLDPDIYLDPTEFKYNRFLDEQGERKSSFFKNGRRLKHFLVPFGSGVSECPGRFFAVNEIKQFLTLVLWFYDLELDDINTDLVPDGTRAGLGILPPPRDVLFKYRRRTETVGIEETPKNLG